MNGCLGPIDRGSGLEINYQEAWGNFIKRENILYLTYGAGYKVGYYIL